LKNKINENGPQTASTADPVLANVKDGWHSAENKGNNDYRKKKKKFSRTQIFFPCGGMAVVKSLLYVNKN
jgi:hypothetical protein